MEILPGEKQAERAKQLATLISDRFTNEIITFGNYCKRILQSKIRPNGEIKETEVAKACTRTGQN